MKPIKIKEQTPFVNVNDCLLNYGYCIVKLPDVATQTEAGIQLNQANYDAAFKFVDTNQLFEIIRLNDKEEQYVVGAKVLLAGHVDGFIFQSKDMGRAMLIDKSSIVMEVVEGLHETQKAIRDVFKVSEYQSEVVSVPTAVTPSNSESSNVVITSDSVVSQEPPLANDIIAEPTDSIE